MCYTIFLSTTSDEDLSVLSPELLQFERIGGADKCLSSVEEDPIEERLAHANRWLLICRYGGCSCHYRHLPRELRDLGFAPPVDWNPEDDDDIESTAAAYDVFRRLLSEGHKLDVIDAWADTPADGIADMPVRLCEVPKEAFRFFDGVRFAFS